MVDSLKLDDEQQVKRYAKYLHENIPLREAVQLSKRVNYFRGAKLISMLTDESTPGAKNKPACNTEDDAIQVGNALLSFGMVHSSQVKDKKRRELEPTNKMVFSPDGYYTWIFEGSSTMRNLMLGALVTCLLIMVCYPIWPQSAKVGTWYISVTMLIFLFILFTVRLIVYVVFWSIGFEFWILPNFFDEDLGVADSFRPVVSFNKAEDLNDTWYFRAFGLGLVIAFGYWCSQQPTEFDELYAQQMDFLSELYEGKLLGDSAAADEEIKVKAVPKLEDLENEILKDEETEDEIMEAALENEDSKEDTCEDCDEETVDI